jgi:hypothetical protein
MTAMRLLQQEFATGEMGFTMSICAAAIRQAECLKGVKTGKAQREHMFSAVHPTTDIAWPNAFSIPIRACISGGLSVLLRRGLLILSGLQICWSPWWTWEKLQS